MPKRWLHELMNYIALWDGYWPYQKWKDKLWEDYGPEHREFRHEDWRHEMEQLKREGFLPSSFLATSPTDYVQLIGNQITKGRKFPLMDEEKQSGVVHEYWDEQWSTLSPEERKGWALAFREVILHPELAPNIFSPDDLRRLAEDRNWRKLQDYVAKAPLYGDGGLL